MFGDDSWVYKLKIHNRHAHIPYTSLCMHHSSYSPSYKLSYIVKKDEILEKLSACRLTQKIKKKTYLAYALSV